MPSQLCRPLRSELAHSVEHPYGASRCAARCSIPRAAPLPAWLTLGLLRHVAHLIWLKQNYKSVSEPQPTHGSAAACSAQGALPTPAGLLSRLVPLPPALLTPWHGPICAGIWSTPRAVGLGSAPLIARLIAVGAEARAG